MLTMNGNRILKKKNLKQQRAKEQQKEQRESKQLDVDPEQILEEQEKRQPQSSDE
jgi:hypothetical protein